jgi:hypothetical protein
MHVDLENPSNPVEYTEFFCTSEIAEVNARKKQIGRPKFF